MKSDIIVHRQLEELDLDPMPLFMGQVRKLSLSPFSLSFSALLLLIRMKNDFSSTTVQYFVCYECVWESCLCAQSLRLQQKQKQAEGTSQPPAKKPKWVLEYT